MKLTVPKDVLHDVFLQLNRWDLDCVQAAAWTFHEVVEDSMKNVCLRRLEGVYINDRDECAMTIRIFSEGGRSITREFLPSLEYDFGTFVVNAIKSAVITFFHVRSSDAWTHIRKKMHELKAPVIVRKLSFTDSLFIDINGERSFIEKFTSIKSLHLDHVKRLHADDVNDDFLRKCAEKGMTDLRLLSCRLSGPQRCKITLDGIFAFVFYPRETLPESITVQLGYVQMDETFVYRLVEEFRSRRPDYCVQISVEGVDMDAQELGNYAVGYTQHHDDVLWRIDSNPWANFIRLSQAFHLFWSRPRHTMLEPL